MKFYPNENILAFYSYKDYLSNHYVSTFYMDNIKFKSVEQAMMYYKAKLFNDKDIMDKLLIETFPPKCKSLGRQVSNFKSDIWDQNKVNIVYNCVFNKFNQNEKLKAKLLSTKDALLVEASPHGDDTWGVPISERHPDITNPDKWTGQNLLGEILMRVRGEL